MRNLSRTLILIVILSLVAGCGRAASTAVPVTSTKVSPTATPAPPTNTPLPPTATPVPPTDTASPTNTPEPTAIPTLTPLPTLTGSGGGVIAFTSEQDGNMEIYVMNVADVPQGAGGSNPQRLTNHPGEDYWPTWSPDGVQIAFASERDGDFEIYAINVTDALQGEGADGANLRRLTYETGNDLEPHWSPDGVKIAFMVYRAGKSDIYSMNTDGSGRQRLTDSDGDNYLPKWSPGGTQIVFVSERDGNPEIYVMNADGSDQRRLTDNPSDDLYPSWSPDGAQVAFYSARDGRPGLYVINIDSGNVRQLTHDDATVWVSDWSLDGSRIAFTSNRDGNREIYLLEIASGALHRLTNNRVLDGIPAWRPQPIPTSVSLGDTQTRPSDGTTMLYVPGGTFSMGSTDAEIEQALSRCRQSYMYCNLGFYERETPQHAVTLDSFWIDQTEVTNAQYRRCVDVGVCQSPTTCGNGDPTFDDASRADHPVVCVDWYDAQAYCEWAGARLPTEAEWEYAARGSEGYLYPWGNEPGGPWQNYCDANCADTWADETVDDGYAASSPVDSYPQGSSWCGAQDLAGNVYEWVADWLGDYPSAPQTNPTGPGNGGDKVLRGSSWISFQDRARGATRDFVRPDRRDNHIGFRCAIDANALESTGTLPDGNNRTVLTYAELMNGFESDSPVDDGAFALPDSASPPDHLFEGRLELFGEASGGGFEALKGGDDLEPEALHLPEFDFAFVQSGDHLIPTQRGLIITDHPTWNYVLEPGRVWKKEGDQGYSRASFPFALVWKGGNATFNGVMTFLFDDTGVSRVWYQITQETCWSLKANFWGLLDAAYHPGPVADADQIRAAYRQELADKFPTQPIEQLALDYPGVDLSALSAGVSPEHLTWYGVVVNGVNYVGGCQTRYGQYAYCDVMRVPSYSTAKSIFASGALMRLAQKYDPGVPKKLIKDFVPKAADSPGDWSTVTFEHVLDMATGNYRSNGFMVDEEKFSSDPFWSREDYAGKIAAAFNWPHATAPDTVWVYRTSDTFILVRALHNYLQTLEGSDADIWEFFVDEVLRPIKVGPGAHTSLRTQEDDGQGQVYGGYGLWWTPDDVAKIAALFNNDGGAANGEQILHPDLLADALFQNPDDRGLRVGVERRYNNGFWADEFTTGQGYDCGFWVPNMLGYSGNVIALLPNGVTYYYFSDNQEFTFDAAVKEIGGMISLCTEEGK